MTAPSPTAPIRVLVVDDHAVVREGIRHVLEGEPDFAVIGEAGNASDALRLVEERQPDVIVLDVSMPGESGLRATPKLRAAAPQARILIMSMHDNAEYVREGVRAGAHGYILKDSAAAELRLAVRAVHAGGAYFSTPAARRLGAAGGDADEGERATGGIDGERPSLDALTARERDVLAGIGRGLTNKEIAAELGISHRTVETHRESLMRKLGIRTVAGLTRFLLDAEGER